MKSLRLLRIAFAFAAIGGTGPWLHGQFNLNCPPNMIVSADSNGCTGTVIYAAPFVSGGAVGDTIYTMTSSPQYYVVPPSVGQVTIEAWGGQGNANAQGVAGGLGGYATGTLNVTPGETLWVYVGGGGATSTNGGYNGGGNAGTTLNCANANGGGGGGASDVRQGGQALSNRVIVAGGGGGAGGNRVATCGRGAGGGGGGGYYGGGGGSGWPGATGGTLPTGGTQSAGGTGGTITSTAGATNGQAGTLGNGGTAGNEVGSNQAGSATALAGGTGGGLTGGPGAFNTNANWTGQSGAGGSSYTGTLGTASTQSGIRTGNGQVRIVAPVFTTLVQTAGLPSGSVFPAGTTTNAFTVTQNSNTDSCSFTVTVQDLVAPTQTCQPWDTLYLGSTCDVVIGDYTTLSNVTDNCDPNPTATQIPAAGTMLSGANAVHNVTVIASDNMQNRDTCQFQVVLIDNAGPTVANCPTAFIYHPSTLNCNPVPVNFTVPTFADNCGYAVQSTHQPGDIFPPGATVVTYTVTDSGGQSASCTFVVSVEQPQLTGFITAPQVCQNDTIPLSAPQGYSSYLWSNGATTSTTFSMTAGWFWVEISDNGCTGRDSVFYQYPAPPAPVVSQSGPQVCTGTFATYQWFLNGNLIPGATSQCYQPLVNGNYAVLVTDNLGCSALATDLNVVANDPAQGIGFDLYPNPSTGLVNVRVQGSISEPGSLRLIDLSGHAVLEMKIDRWDVLHALNLKGLAGGAYLVEIEAGTMKGRQRLLFLP